MAEPKATPETMMPNAAARGCDQRFRIQGRTFLMCRRRAPAKIDDRQKGENERLDRADEKVEELDEERHDGHAEREIERARSIRASDDRRDDDEEQLADEDIEEQPRGERDRAQRSLRGC